MKKIACLILVVLTLIASTTRGDMDRGEFYPRLTVVVDCTPIDNEYIIECIDRSGNIWSFYSEDTWDIGDLANLLMWNITGIETEDEIIEVYYEGYISNLDLFFEITGQ